MSGPSAEAKNNEGDQHYIAGRYDEAAQCFREAVRIDPRIAVYQSNLGAALANKGDFDEAEACLREAIRLDHHYAPAHAELAFLLHRYRGKLDGAEQHYREAARIDPQDTCLQNNLGTLLLQKGDLGCAEACLREAIKLNPANANPRKHLALVLLQRDQNTVEAEAELREALRLNPKYPAAHIDLGELLDRQGAPLEDVEECYRLAIRWSDVPPQENRTRNPHQLRSDCVSAHIHLGTLLETKKNDFEGALKCFARSFSIEGENSEARQGLLRVALLAGGQRPSAGRVDQADHQDTAAPSRSESEEFARLKEECQNMTELLLETAIHSLSSPSGRSIDFVRRFAAICPANVYAQLCLATALAGSADDRDRVKEICSNILDSLSPGNPRALNIRGCLSEEADERSVHFRAAMAACTDEWPIPAFNLAMILKDSDVEEAFDLFTAVLDKLSRSDSTLPIGAAVLPNLSVFNDASRAEASYELGCLHLKLPQRCDLAVVRSLCASTLLINENHQGALSMLESLGLELDFGKLTISLTDVVGHGGFSTVFYGTFEEKPVAVKLVSSEHKTLQDVIREVCITKSHQDHPNIAKVIGFCSNLNARTHRMDPFIVMEYAAGGSLKEWIAKRSGPPPLDQIIDLLCRIADSVRYLHESNPPVIHRDIKPANVLLQSPDDLTPLLADFGEAKVMEKTAASTVLGTKFYMAPELQDFIDGRVSEKPRYTLAADIYSLGITLKCLARGANEPLSGTDGITHQVLRSIIESMTVEDPGLRTPIDEVCSLLEDIKSGVYPIN